MHFNLPVDKSVDNFFKGAFASLM